MIIIPCLYDLSYTYCCVLSISVVEVLLKIPGVVVVVVVNVFCHFVRSYAVIVWNLVNTRTDSLPAICTDVTPLLFRYTFILQPMFFYQNYQLVCVVIPPPPSTYTRTHHPSTHVHTAKT